MNNPSFFLAGATEDIQVKALNNPRADGMVIIVGPTTQNEILIFEWSAHIWLSTCNPRATNHLVMLEEKLQKSSQPQVT